MSGSNFEKPIKSEYVFLQTVAEKRQTLTRRAPPAPRLFSVGSEKQQKYGSAPDALRVTYSNVKKLTKSERLPADNSQKCWVEILVKLITSEKQYIRKLKVLMEQLQSVSTNVCNKLPLLKSIFDFHTKILLRKMIESVHQSDIAYLFLEYEKKFQQYVVFTKVRHDFSYLVVDSCNAIIDHFKSRLLEYNFTLSELKDVCGDNLAVQTICENAEDAIKGVYQAIVFEFSCLYVDEQ